MHDDRDDYQRVCEICQHAIPGTAHYVAHTPQGEASYCLPCILGAIEHPGLSEPMTIYPPAVRG